MRVHCLSHVPHEGPGILRELVARRGGTLTEWRLFESPQLPALDAIDWLIIMGGPMSVNDAPKLSWMPAEQALIRALVEQIQAGGPGHALGICLGAQFLAQALGAKVAPLPEQEIGWWPVHLSATPGPLGDWPTAFAAFHWHGEGLALPAGCENLASSAQCPHQAFACGPRILGLQFHAEMTPTEVRVLIDAHRPLPSGVAVQSAQQMLSAPERYAALNQRLLATLDRWLDADRGAGR